MSRNESGLFSRFTLQAIVLHPAFLFLVAVGITIFGSVQIWNTYKTQIVDNNDFLLDESHFHIKSQPPDWAGHELSKLVLEQFEEPPSLLDESLVTNTSMALHKVGFVRQVQKVQKSRNGLEIDVVYRQPIALVHLPDGTTLPVDSQAVLMPTHSVEDNEQSLLRIYVFRASPHNGDWNIWPDERIMDAATICAALQPDAGELGLYRVVSWQRPGRNIPLTPFEIWTPFGNGNRPNAKIIWGNAPGKEPHGEATVDQKLNALKAYVEEFGELSSAPTKMKIDVRSGTVVLVDDQRMAEHDELFNDVK